MARVPEIIRRRTISQVADQPGQSGIGFAALADLAKMGAEFLRPAAREQATVQGQNAVYRDNDGQLKVDRRSALGGEMADVHNAAAFAKFLSQKQMDTAETMTELARQHQFNPDAFRQAADAVVAEVEADENIPAVLKSDIVANVRQEATRRFNGLFNNEIDRTHSEANKSTIAARSMLVDDFVNLSMLGEEEAAAAKLKEIEEITRFRVNSPFISETENDGDLFLRGVRGSAKAAKLARRLENLEGATELPEDVRREIDEVLKDPDLDPATRSRLYSATQGTIKTIDARSIVAGLTSGTYESKVIRVESKGNPNETNPDSSALGTHGFLAGTWLDNVAEMRAAGRAEWARGKSKEEILELRKDTSVSSQVFAHFRDKNRHALARAGLPVDDGTEYMAHFFGAGGAITVLSADPDTPLTDIVSPKAIRDNPFLKNMTARDARNWAARKMTVKASDLARQQVVIDQLEDREMAGIASRALAEQIRARRRLEDIAAQDIGERVASNDDGLTEQEIAENHDLADDDQRRLIDALRKEREDQIDIATTIARLNSPTAVFNRFDKDDQKSLNKAFEAATEGGDPMTPENRTAAVQVAARTGFLPDQAFTAIRSAVSGDDPARFGQAMEILNAALESDPGAIDMHGGAKGVKDALSDFKFFSKFNTATDAAARVIEMRDRDVPKNLTDKAKDLSKDLEADDVISHLSARGVSARLGTDAQTAALMDDYRRLFQSHFTNTGDFDLAQNRALDEVSKIYGPNEVSGNGALMRYPPQNFINEPPGQEGWMRRQLESEVSQLEFGAEASPPEGFFGALEFSNFVPDSKWINSRDIILQSDDTTRAQVNSGSSPSYTVLYRDQDGELQVIPGRFNFDLKTHLGGPEGRPGREEALKRAATRGRRDFEEAQSRSLEMEDALLQEQISFAGPEELPLLQERLIQRVGKEKAAEIIGRRASELNVPPPPVE